MRTLPSFAPLLASHEELRAAIRSRDHRRRWNQLLRHPLRTVANRLWERRLPAYQSDFEAYPGWPDDIREKWNRLPEGFITSFSLKPDSAHWLYELIRNNDFQCIVECGCGISSAVIALAIGLRPCRFISLEQDEHWMELTRATLSNLGLDGRVQLVHAPMRSISFAGREFQAHDAGALGETKINLLLIDAPPAEIGRAGVVPMLGGNLQKHALVLLDDAARTGEGECVRMWAAEGRVEIQTFVPIGTGMAVLNAV